MTTHSHVKHNLASQSKMKSENSALFGGWAFHFTLAGTLNVAQMNGRPGLKELRDSFFRLYKLFCFRLESLPPRNGIQ